MCVGWWGVVGIGSLDGFGKGGWGGRGKSGVGGRVIDEGVGK